MEKKITDIFNFTVASLTAAVLAAFIMFAEELTSSWIYATKWNNTTGAQAFPLIVIYALPLVVGLLAAAIAAVVGAARRKSWLQNQEPIWIVTSIVIVLIITGLAAIFIFADNYWQPIALEGAWGFWLTMSSVVVAAISLGIVISMVQGIKKVWRTQLPEERQPVGYSRMFAISWLVFGIVMVSFGFWFDVHWGSDIEPYGYFATNVMWFGAIFTAAVAAAAGLFCLIGQLWRRSKVVAIFVALLTAVVFCTAFVLYVGSTLKKNHNTWHDHRKQVEQYEQGNGYDNVGIEEVYDEEDYSEDAEPDWWDYYDSIDEYYAETDMSTDDAVSAAVKYAAENVDVSDVEWYGASKFMPWLPDYEEIWSNDAPRGPGSGTYRELATYLFHRSCSFSLKELFDRYSSIVTLYLSEEKYTEKGYRRAVDLLVAAYDDMDGDSDKFAKMYRYMNNYYNSDYSFEEAMGLVEKYISSETKAAFGLGYGEDRKIYVDNDEYYDWDAEARWAFSFWGRRHNECESNPEDIYDVLTAIQELYAVEENESGKVDGN